jgi:hypothetical protein
VFNFEPAFGCTNTMSLWSSAIVIAALRGCTATLRAIEATSCWMPSPRVSNASAMSWPIDSLRTRCHARSNVPRFEPADRASPTAAATAARRPSVASVTFQCSSPTVMVSDLESVRAATARTAARASLRVMPLTSTPSIVTPGMIRSACARSYRAAAYAPPPAVTSRTAATAPSVSSSPR